MAQNLEKAMGSGVLSGLSLKLSGLNVAQAAMQMIEDASADDRLENNLAKMTGAHEKIRKMRRKSLSEHALSGI